MPSNTAALFLAFFLVGILNFLLVYLLGGSIFFIIPKFDLEFNNLGLDLIVSGLVSSCIEAVLIINLLHEKRANALLGIAVVSTLCVISGLTVDTNWIDVRLVAIILIVLVFFVVNFIYQLEKKHEIARVLKIPFICVVYSFFHLYLISAYRINPLETITLVYVFQGLISTIIYINYNWKVLITFLVLLNFPTLIWAYILHYNG